MKRALPSYDDLLSETEDFETEEGEIFITEEQEDTSSSGSVKIDEYEDFDDLGLKPVLPVGRYDETFREGDEPSSGEQYLCTVRSQRSKLNRIISCNATSSKNVSLEDLCKKYGGSGTWKQLEVDGKWAQNFWDSYKQNEQAVLGQFESIDNIENIDNFFTLDSSELFKKLYQTREIHPTLALLRALYDEQGLLEKLINFHRKWLESEQEALIISSDLDTLNIFATWLNALLLLRDALLTSPEIASLRQLASCILCTEKYRNLKIFQEIISIIVKKYGQIDLIKFI